MIPLCPAPHSYLIALYIYLYYDCEKLEMFEYMFSYIMLPDLPIIYVILLDLLLFDTLTSDI